jgi:AcrR family transcriptional regulator
MGGPTDDNLETRPQPGTARENVLDTAERHFARRGYAAVTLKDIARDLGMRQPSLYYHAPGGKEELYVEVMVRHLARHREGVEAAVGTHDPAEGVEGLRARLERAAHYMLSRPPIDLRRIAFSDLPDLSPDNAKRLEAEVGRSLFGPIMGLFTAALAAGQLRHNDVDLHTISFLTLVDVLRNGEPYSGKKAETLVTPMLDMLLHGIAAL